MKIFAIFLCAFVAQACQDYKECGTCVVHSCLFVETLDEQFDCVKTISVFSPVKRIYRTINRCGALFRKMNAGKFLPEDNEHKMANATIPTTFDNAIITTIQPENVSTTTIPPTMIDLGKSPTENASLSHKVSTTKLAPIASPSHIIVLDKDKGTNMSSSFETNMSQHIIPVEFLPVLITNSIKTDDNVVPPVPYNPNLILDKNSTNGNSTDNDTDKVVESITQGTPTSIHMSTVNPHNHSATIIATTMLTTDENENIGKEDNVPITTRNHQRRSFPLTERALIRKIKRDACKLARDFVIYNQINNLGPNWFYFAIKNPMNTNFQECAKLLKKRRSKQ